MKHTKSRATIYCFRNNDTKIALRSKATFSLLFSLLSFLWKRQFERREKNEKRKVKRTKRNDNLPKENCRFFLAGDEGFEPSQTESESVVLPLHKSPMDYFQQTVF